MTTPHDKFFKAVFSGVEHARSELVSVLPTPIVQAIDWSSLTLVSGEHSDGMDVLESDLLFSALLDDEPLPVHRAGGDAALPRKR